MLWPIQIVEAFPMANPVSHVVGAQQPAQVTQATQPAKQAAPSKSAAPQDTVSISSQGKAASQAQAEAKAPQAPGDTDQDGESK
jgi:hypothetical protein